MSDSSVLAELEGKAAESVTALDLYYRWERRQWLIQDLDPALDAPGWQAQYGFVRAELLRGLVGFFLGEVAVTRTLAPLAHAAPDPDYQLYLCTQLADEARHTLFFQRYLTVLDGTRGHNPAHLHDAERRSQSFADLFEHELGAVTDAVRRDPTDETRWYEAVVLYHLLAEGTLAMTTLHSMLRMVRTMPDLPVLRAGLTNVARDESRHVGFGVTALRDAVRAGRADAVRSALGPVRSSDQLSLVTIE